MNLLLQYLSLTGTAQPEYSTPDGVHQKQHDNRYYSKQRHTRVQKAQTSDPERQLVRSAVKIPAHRHQRKQLPKQDNRCQGHVGRTIIRDGAFFLHFLNYQNGSLFQGPCRFCSEKHYSIGGGVCHARRTKSDCLSTTGSNQTVCHHHPVRMKYMLCKLILAMIGTKLARR